MYFPCSIISLHALSWNLNEFVLLHARPKNVYFSFRQDTHLARKSNSCIQPLAEQRALNKGTSKPDVETLDNFLRTNTQTLRETSN